VVSYRVLAAVLISVLALSVPTVATAGTWSWGYNYLGNSTDNGLCVSWLPHPGSVCSGWNYGVHIVEDQQGGGSFDWGFGNNNVASYWTICCQTLWDRTAAQAGMGGYLKAVNWYVSGGASYVNLYANT